MPVKPQPRTERLNFTKKAVDAFPIPAEKRASYYDTQVRGLGVLVQPTGHKSFFWFRKVRGYPSWQTIGIFPDLTVEQARTNAAEFNSKLARWKADNYDGDDPFTRASALTLETLLAEYVEHRVKTYAANPERAVPETQGMTRYFPTLKGRSLGTIRPADIRNLHQQIGKENGHVIANRVMEFIKRLYNWAVETQRWSGQNPAENIQKFHEEKRTRYLQREEAGNLLRQLRTEAHGDLRDFVLLALMTGARKKDILCHAVGERLPS